MNPTPDDSPTFESTSETDVLAEARIEVVAEIGRVSLRLDELAGLARGSVLALGQRRVDVTLTVQGRTWARGELVNVDDELAVRLTAVEAPR